MNRANINVEIARITTIVVDHHFHMKLLHLSVTTVMKQYNSDLNDIGIFLNLSLFLAHLPSSSNICH